MQPAPVALLSMLLIAISGGSATAVRAADPCSGFKWDVSKERALFDGQSVPVTVGRDTASAPAIDIDRLYRLTLVPEAQVSFALPPGKATTMDGAYGGVATFRIKSPGAYRVSIDLPLWIDVAANGKLLATKDFQGQRDCDAPHKIVEYELRGSQSLVLQLSGSAQPSIRLTVTLAPGGD